MAPIIKAKIDTKVRPVKADFPATPVVVVGEAAPPAVFDEPPCVDWLAFDSLRMPPST